jgi:hypothetical protein
MHSETVKLNKINLQNPSNLKEYRLLLHYKLINLAPKQEIDEEWEQISSLMMIS